VIEAHVFSPAAVAVIANNLDSSWYIWEAFWKVNMHAITNTIIPRMKIIDGGIALLMIVPMAAPPNSLGNKMRTISQ
jgi:hypothetical protein